jgi:hypothetical protein
MNRNMSISLINPRQLAKKSLQNNRVDVVMQCLMCLDCTLQVMAIRRITIVHLS